MSKYIMYLVVFVASFYLLAGRNFTSSSDSIPLPGHRIPLAHISAHTQESPSAPLSQINAPILTHGRAFYISCCEIQTETFAAYLNAFPEKLATFHGQFSRCLRRIRPRPGLNKQPVTHVSARDAIAFCDWLSSVSGRHCRLPTVMEWEQMALAGARGTPYPWGWDSPANRAVFNQSGPRASGFYPATGPGLNDVIGNVYEWCWDPITSTASIKGGAWSDTHPKTIRIQNTFKQSPTYRSADIGFRIVVDLRSQN